MSGAKGFREGRTSAASVPRTTGRSGSVGLDLVARAEGCLRKSSYLGLRCVYCEACEGVLVLHGRVSSFYLKQLAQELVRRIEGWHTIENKVEVGPRPTA
jgi:hypothetical protein